LPDAVQRPCFQDEVGFESAMRTSIECRRLAAEAEDLARQLSRYDHRDEALKIADEWRRLAETLERNERSFDPR
jgi:hypothetical protein